MRALIITASMVVTQFVTSASPVNPEVVQFEDYAPCGKTSLFAVLQLLGSDASWEHLSMLLDPFETNKTHSLADLSSAARELGFYSLGIKLSKQQLRDLPLPCIVHVRDFLGEPSHFIVLLVVQGDGIIKLDAPRPPEFQSWAEFDSSWTGNALVIAKSRFVIDSLALRTSYYYLWILLAGLLLLVFLYSSNWKMAIMKAFAICVSSVRFGSSNSVLAFALKAGAAVVVIGGVAFAVLFVQEDVHAQINLDRSVRDLGELSLGPHSEQIKITNTGRGALEILGTTSDCSCASILAPGTLQSEQSGVLDIRLDVSAGPHLVVLTIESNDPFGPKRVALKYVGSSDIRTVPPRVYAWARNDEPFEKIVKVLYPSGQSLAKPEFAGFECSLPSVRIESIGKADAVNGDENSFNEFSLRVSVMPSDIPQLLETNSRVFFRQGDVGRELSLPISINFVGPMMCNPSSLLFASPAPNDIIGRTRIIDLKTRKCSGNAIRSVLSKNEQGQKLELRVVSAPPLDFAAHTIQFKLNGNTCKVKVITFVKTRTN
jgi:hypothetical protein